MSNHIGYMDARITPAQFKCCILRPLVCLIQENILYHQNQRPDLYTRQGQALNKQVYMMSCLTTSMEKVFIGVSNSNTQR